jgi:hypothetical protein
MRNLLCNREGGNGGCLTGFDIIRRILKRGCSNSETWDLYDENIIPSNRVVISNRPLSPCRISNASFESIGVYWSPSTGFET